MNLSKKCKICVQCDECGEKKLISGENISYSPLKRWKKIFHRYKQNALEKIFQRYQQNAAKKKIFHRYQQNAVKENFSPLKLQILQILTTLLSTLILYSQEMSLKYVTDGAVH